MISLLLLAASSAELQSLDQAVGRCDRSVASPVFSGEADRRSHFLLETFAEQEAIVAARSELSRRSRELREGAASDATTERKLRLEEAALEDRQRALNDRRLLENIRREAIDSMRHNFVTQCLAGRQKD